MYIHSNTRKIRTLRLLIRTHLRHCGRAPRTKHQPPHRRPGPHPPHRRTRRPISIRIITPYKARPITLNQRHHRRVNTTRIITRRRTAVGVGGAPDGVYFDGMRDAVAGGDLGRVGDVPEVVPAAGDAVGTVLAGDVLAGAFVAHILREV